MSTKSLFTPLQVGASTTANRIFMAPLTRTRAGPTHVANALMAEYYAQRASAGLIITEGSMLGPTLSGFNNDPGFYTTEQLLGWKGVTDAVHAKGGKIFSQVVHPGRAAHPDSNFGAEPVGPSAIAIEGVAHTPHGKVPNAVPHAVDVDEIPALVQMYATAAKNAVQVAGFDGVEIHGANGYLIDEFLRESANQRTDGYGGSLENRTRFLKEVLAAVVDAVGADRVGVRFSPLNSYNSMKTADPEALCEAVAKIAQSFDLAYVHVMRRDTYDLQKGDLLPIFRTHFKNTLIGNFGYTKDEANEAIAAGQVDAVAFGAAYIANPDLVERFAANAPLNTPDPKTFYVGGATGYTDYPTLAQSSTAP
ncbi:Aste57867_8694 [Aphanomyces stellatus]|uniref:Aste57867_8694 protein n=1 Tax=Aphanomyces stellatus TaxID=120398 RepID=A0A485KL34_9STRA|nr:hypothetical protein As57867_008660 [Aphanomyces stellatus]VFT85580.1 Aste57867_8694 [Aphanomyces stellatus]